MSDTQPSSDAPQSLFEDLPGGSQAQAQAAQQSRAAAKRQGAALLLVPHRRQVELRTSGLESLLSEDHRVRLVWGCVERQDLSRLTNAVKARGSNAGRAAIDPRILFALWLYASMEGVASGRLLARLSTEHDAYRWICGGVSVNYDALDDFRSGKEVLMDEVLTANVAALAAVGAISLERVAQDGMRVRADAGAASFRRQASLERHLADTGELVEDIKRRTKDDPAAGSRRARAARARAAKEREERIGRGLQQLPKVQAAKRHIGDKAEDARVSTTDADARVMKMGDGGFPAHEQIEAVHERTQGKTEVIAPARSRGLQRLPVRGLSKARAVACLYALAHNLMRIAKRAPQMIGRGTDASAIAPVAA